MARIVTRQGVYESARSGSGGRTLLARLPAGMSIREAKRRIKEAAILPDLSPLAARREAVRKALA